MCLLGAASVCSGMHVNAAVCCCCCCRSPAAEFLKAEQRRQRRPPQPAAAVSDSDDSEVCRGKDRVLTCSVTIVVPGGDIPWAVYNAAASFLRECCMCTERGDAFKHLHVQGVLKKRSTSSVKIKHELVENQCFILSPHTTDS